MIASAAESEGKTLTAANLSLTLSESYHRTVLLIDADLRRPSLHTLLKLPGTPGLTESLLSSIDTPLQTHRLSTYLTVLTAGRASSDPMAGLTSPRMRQILDDAREKFDWVIIDTPPVGLLTDANLLGAMVDGAVLVVRAGSTPYTLVKRAAEHLGPNRMLGVVLNRATANMKEYGYGYYAHYYAAPGSESDTRAKTAKQKS
jgi:capsular exopolysaccharide synthesis family protein